MKILLINLSLWLFCISTYGQGDTTIYGIAQNSSPLELYLAKINPSTGVVTNISTSSLAASYTFESAIDPINNVFYFISNGTFTGVNMTTGNIVSSPAITNSNGTYFICFLFNYSDTAIYGLAQNISPTELYLAKINPSTGVITNISTSSLAASSSFEPTVDPINNIFYFSNNGKFIGVNMTTGNIVSNPTITNSNGAYFGNFLFNCSDTTIYGLAQNSSPYETYLAKINPSTGVVTNISTSSLVTCYTPSGTAIDPINNIYYFITNGTFTGVNMTTGNIVSSPSITNSNGTYFSSFRSGNDCKNIRNSAANPDIIKTAKISIYPNPLSSEATIRTNTNFENTTLSVYNSFGQTVKQIKNISGQTVIFLRDNLANGLYFVHITKDNQVIATKKIIITG